MGSKDSPAAANPPAGPALPAGGKADRQSWLCRKPVNVVFLIDELETWGGAERQLFDLAQALCRHRFDPLIVVLGRARLVPRFRQAGLPVHELGVSRIYGLSGLAGLAALTSCFARRRTKLLVTYHTGSDLVGPLAALPLGIVTLSSRRDEGFTKKPLHVRAQREINRWVAGMIAVSCAVRNAVVRDEGFPASRIQVIPNGVDAARYSRHASPLRGSLGIGPDEVVIGTLANFFPIKGYDVLLPAIEQVCSRTDNVRFICFGEGPLLEAARTRLKPLGQRVFLPGTCSDVAPALSAMDIFVLASHTEGMSNAILQAMAAECAVCATAVGGNPELVTERTGILVPPGEPGELAQALEGLARAPGRVRAMGGAGHQRVARHFSFARMTQRYEDVFEAALQETAVSPSRRAAKHLLAHGHSLARPLLRPRRRAEYLALCYHRVTKQTGGWNPAMLVTQDVFRQQLELLGRHYELVTAGELVRAMLAEEQRRLCAVTFDDGYADTLEVALPVLQQCGAKATVFVATAPPDGQGALWYEQMALLLRDRLGDSQLLEVSQVHPALSRLAELLACSSSLARALRRVLLAMENAPTKEREAAQQALLELFGPPPPGQLPRFLDWNGVRTLQAAGIEIGAHTMSHPNLATTDAQRARAEIIGCRDRLEAELGAPVAGFAYPSGKYRETTVELVRQAGFSWAFVADPIRWTGNPYLIPRRVMEERSSRGYMGIFSAAALLAEVEGGFDRFR